MENYHWNHIIGTGTVPGPLLSMTSRTQRQFTSQFSNHPKMISFRNRALAKSLSHTHENR